MLKSFPIPIVLCLVLNINAEAQVAPEAKDISPLLIGEKVPDIDLTSLNGEKASILAMVKAQPTLIVFYRGGWCPYCNIQLGEMNNIKQEIVDLGYQIIAVGTDTPDKMKNTVDENELEYELYSDADTKVSQAFGIAFEASDRKKEQLKNTSNGANPGNLPVPAVFVIDQQGFIQFEYINPDYKIRLKSEMLMAVLKALSSQGVE